MGTISAALNREWDRRACSVEARRALLRWRRLWPAFADCRDLRDVLDRRRDRERAQEVLRPLALMAPSDDLAARTLLQALMPGLMSLARSVASDDPCGLDELVALAWERVRTYPGHRQGSVAGNVLLDVRKRYLKQRGFGAPVADVAQVSPEFSDPNGHEHEYGLDTDLVVGFLHSAVLGGALSGDDLDAIVRSRMFDVPLREIAEERGISARALGQQRWRAEERLRRMPEADQVRSWSAA